MPAEDRDRLFERALARHLRDHSSGADPACLDAEMLAAYYEGALSEEEMSSAKNHLVSCPRCRGIAAQLAATQTVSELRNQEDESTIRGAVSTPKNSEVYGDAARASKATRAPRETESRVAHFPTKKKWLLRWAAPAAAIAAGILLYVGASILSSYKTTTELARTQNRADTAEQAIRPGS